MKLLLLIVCCCALLAVIATHLECANEAVSPYCLLLCVASCDRYASGVR